jgi:ketosteroid isomerase-like protein
MLAVESTVRLSFGPGCCKHRGRRILLVAGLLGAFAPRARAQVIPGVAMSRADARAEGEAYRSSVHNELMAVVSEWSRLAERRDSAGLAALYSGVAKSSATGVDDASGAASIVRQLWRLHVAGAQTYFTVDDFDTSGDIALVAGVLTLQPTTQGGPAATMEARAIFVMLRDSRGRWHIRHQSIAVAPAG